MEHLIHNETATPATHDDNWQPRPELLQAMHRIATIAAYDDSAMVSDREVSLNWMPLRVLLRGSKSRVRVNSSPSLNGLLPDPDSRQNNWDEGKVDAAEVTGGGVGMPATGAGVGSWD